MKKKILLVYTGGTIGMIKDKTKKSLVPFNFNKLIQAIPKLKNNDCDIESISILNPIDSSNMSPENWIEIVTIIKNNYNYYDGFVILHGTDTMAYTASALSFMLENINKPVILTGSQIPIGERRTDANENLITSIEIATSSKINEVCIYFEDKLYRGNRTVKINSEDFEAFVSPNYQILAEAGVKIKYKHISRKVNSKFIAHTRISNDIAILCIFPGIKEKTIKNIIKSATGIVIKSFGSGNAPFSNSILEIFKDANKQNKILLNISQCLYGSTIEGQYESSEIFTKSGVICGKDLTTEAAVAKLMFLLGCGFSKQKIKTELQKNLRGEMTI